MRLPWVTCLYRFIFDNMRLMDITLIIIILGFALLAGILIYGISVIQRRQREGPDRCPHAAADRCIEGAGEVEPRRSSNAASIQMGQLNSTISNQFNQLLSQVNLRLKESSELIQKTNQGLGEDGRSHQGIRGCEGFSR